MKNYQVNSKLVQRMKYRFLLFVVLLPFMFATLFATGIHIGPSLPYTNIQAAGWCFNLMIQCMCMPARIPDISSFLISTAL